MPAPKEYQGHRSWNAWNVSLWLWNDEPTYRLCCDVIRRAKGNKGRAAAMLRRDYLPARTPDGGVYTQLAVKLALQDFDEVQS